MRERLLNVGAAGMLLVAVLPLDGYACSCVPLPQGPLDEQVRSAFAESTAVFLAKVVAAEMIEISSTSGGRDAVLPAERATFRVLRSWKGPKKVGDKVVLVTPRLCGKTARNDPMWLEEIGPTAGRTRAAEISDIWLVYAAGDEPWELSLCNRSLPIDVGDTVEEIEILGVLTRTSGVMGPNNALEQTRGQQLR